jgi:hypothetical protein
MRNRFRLRFHFWLDMNKPEEAALAETIGELKSCRSFAQAVRQGIRLVVSLAQGDISVLELLFPQVVEGIYMAGVEAAKDEFRFEVTDRLDELAASVRQLEAGGLKALPAATDPQTSSVAPMLVSGNLKSLAGSSQPLPGPPDHDDLADLLEVKDVSSEGGGVAAQNLINSMLAMQSTKSDKPAKPSKAAKRERRSLDDLLEVRVVGSA